MANKKFLLLIVLSAIIFTGLIGAITFQNIFPTTTPYVTSSSTVNLSYGINAEDGLSSITHSWNGTNTTLYDSSLVLFMNFDNRSELGENDTIVKDLSMYGNNGTVVGGENISWTANGKYGGAFNFSGKKSYIQVLDSNSLDFNRTTISFWVKTDNTTQEDIITKWNYVTNNRTWGIILYHGYPQFTVSFNGSSSLGYFSENVLSTKMINNSQWNMVTFVYNGTDLLVYINGIYDTKNDWLKGIYFGYSNLYIGNAVISSNYLNSTLDDFMIWNRSLSTSEIDFLYHSQITKYNESYFEYNSTINNSALGVNNFVCSKNATLNEFCSSTSAIRSLNNVKSNFSNSIGEVSDIFYGVNNPVVAGSSKTAVFINGNGIYSDSTYHRDLMGNSNTVFYRVSMNLYESSISEGVFNDTVWLTVTGSIANKKDFVDYAHSMGYKVLFIVDSVPGWLANKTSGYCNSSDWGTCSPTDYTKFGELVVDFLNATDCGLYPETCYVEVRNEPANHLFLFNTLTTDGGANASLRSAEVNKEFNYTYNAIKAVYPNIKVGGVGVTDYVTSKDTYIINSNFLGNFSNVSDFFTFHIYKYTYSTQSMSTLYDLSLNAVIQNLSAYNSNISDIFLDESSDINAVMLNSSDVSLYRNEYAVMYSSTLNKVNSNITSIMPFLWSEQIPYFPSTYPKFEWVSEPNLNNSIYPPYYVASNFSHLCPAGATVSVTSSDSTCLKQVACQKGNMYALIPINVCDYAINVTANLSLTNGSVFYPYNKIQNYETGALLNVGTDGIVQLGVLDSYETLYLSSATSDTKLLSNRFKLDEYNGNTVYDAMYNTSNGTRSGADWETDGIWNTLNGISHYTFNAVTGLFTILTSDNLFSYMALSWSESSISMMRTNFTAGIDNVSSKVPVLFLILIIVVILSVLAVLTIVFYALMNKVNSSSLGFLKGGI